MHSATITLRDLTTGAGIAGLTVTLRGPADSYTANLYTATGVAGKPGAYEFVGVVFGKYKLFVNGVEDKTFGGDNGRYFPVSDMTDIALCLDGDNYNALDKKITNVHHRQRVKMQSTKNLPTLLMTRSDRLRL